MGKSVRYPGATWKSELRNPTFWQFIDKIPDYHYWSVHKALKQQMTEFIVRRLKRQHKRNGTGHSVTERMARKLVSPENDALVVASPAALLPISELR